METAFAVWITGLPAAGKSSLARALERKLNAEGIQVARLESDEMHRVLAPQPTYSDAEQDVCCDALTYLAGVLTEHGVPVILDAAANRRARREHARRSLRHFLEVFVDCPFEVRAQRDSKGVRRPVPTAFERSAHADLVVRGDLLSPGECATLVLGRLRARGFLAHDSRPTPLML